MRNTKVINNKYVSLLPLVEDEVAPDRLLQVILFGRRHLVAVAVHRVPADVASALEENQQPRHCKEEPGQQVLRPDTAALRAPSKISGQHAHMEDLSKNRKPKKREISWLMRVYCFCQSEIQDDGSFNNVTHGHLVKQSMLGKYDQQ